MITQHGLTEAEVQHGRMLADCIQSDLWCPKNYIVEMIGGGYQMKRGWIYKLNDELGLSKCSQLVIEKLGTPYVIDHIRTGSALLLVKNHDHAAFCALLLHENIDDIGGLERRRKEDQDAVHFARQLAIQYAGARDAMDLLALQEYQT